MFAVLIRQIHEYSVRFLKIKSMIGALVVISRRYVSFVCIVLSVTLLRFRELDCVMTTHGELIVDIRNEVV